MAHIQQGNRLMAGAGRVDVVGGASAYTTMQSSVTQYGITWTFDTAYPVGQYITGDYFVVGSPTITAISPAMTQDAGSGTNRRNGSRLNPQPEEYTAWDSRTFAFSANNTLFDDPPIAMVPGDSLVSTISRTTTSVVDVSGHTTTQPYITDAAVLTCVASAPSSTAFRPAYVDVAEKGAYDSANLDLSWLASVLVAPSSGAPSVGSIAARFSRPWTASHIRDFVGRGSQPSNNMSSYYEYVAEDYAQAMLLLLSSGVGDKTALLRGFVQEAIDHYYCIRNYAANSSTNKAPLILAAKLLGSSGSSWFTVLSGSAAGHPWREVEQTYYWADKQSTNSSSIVTAGQVWTGYTPPVFWRQDPGNNEHEHLHPSEWDVVANGGGDKREAYRWSSVSQTWPGLWLGLKISGLDSYVGHAPWGEYVDRWMSEDMTTHEATIQTYYPTFNGTYQTSGFAWIDAMWNDYRGSF